MSLIVGVLTLTYAMPAFATPKQMVDGNMFDAVYYATNNPDVVAVLGTDETMLYNHYINSGKYEGRIPCENGVPSMEVAPPEMVQVPVQPKVSAQPEVPQKQPIGGSGVIVPDHEETGDNLVWVPIYGGTKYHTGPGCSNMEEPMQVRIETAISNGYTPCKRCH